MIQEPTCHQQKKTYWISWLLLREDRADVRIEAREEDRPHSSIIEDNLHSRMNPRKFVRELLKSIVALLLSGIAVWGQTIGASIQGSITDSAGSALPNATVEVRNMATGFAHTVGADAAGRYRVPLLPSGDYEVRVTAPGFQPMLRLLRRY